MPDERTSNFPKTFLFIAAGWFLVGAIMKAAVASKHATAAEMRVGTDGKDTASGTSPKGPGANGDPDYYRLDPPPASPCGPRTLQVGRAASRSSLTAARPFRVFDAAKINGSRWGAEFEADGSLLCDDQSGQQSLVVRASPRASSPSSPVAILALRFPLRSVSPVPLPRVPNGRRLVQHCQNYGCDEFVCFCDILQVYLCLPDTACFRGCSQCRAPQRPIRDCQHYCCCDISAADHRPKCVQSGAYFLREGPTPRRCRHSAGSTPPQPSPSSAQRSLSSALVIKMAVVFWHRGHPGLQGLRLGPERQPPPAGERTATHKTPPPHTNQPRMAVRAAGL